MNKHSRMGSIALFFSVLLAVNSPILAFADTQATTTPQTKSIASYSGWGWDSLKTYVGTLGSDPVMNFRIPVLMEVEVKNLADTWGDARSNGRSHEGIDILAPKGTPVVSPTKAVVSSTGYGSLGGNYVYTINAGGERFYFAHLDSYAPGIISGKVLEPGDVIGYVGNTGNASGGPAHLHFGIYKSGGATNPYPRLTLAFTEAERVLALNKIADGATDQQTTAQTLVAKYKAFLTGAQVKGLTLAQSISNALSGVVVAQAASAPSPTLAYANTPLTRDLTLGSTGEDVRTLQKFLNAHGAIIATTGPGSAGNETTYFGPATKAALASYQQSQKIAPSSGYFGPLTRSLVRGQLAVIVAMN